MESSQRNNCVDILRIVSAFCIISLHNFSGSGHPFGEELTAMARFAVPLFFMISGYFAAAFDRGRRVKQIKKLLFLTAASNIGYFLYRMLDAATGRYLPGFFAEKFTWDAFWTFFWSGESSVAGHLWFLSALLYVVILDHLLLSRLEKLRHGRAIVAAIAVVLLVAGLSYYHINTTVLHRELPYQNYRNFFFMGTPFYLFGKLLRGSRLLEIKLNVPVLAVLLLALFGTCLGEYWLLGVKEIYLSSIVTAFVLLIFALQHPMEHAGRGAKALAAAGRKYALPVYVVHMFMLDKVRGVYFSYVPWGTYKPGFYFIPLITLLLSLLAAWVYAGGMAAAVQHLTNYRYGSSKSRTRS